MRSNLQIINYKYKKLATKLITFITIIEYFYQIFI